MERNYIFFIDNKMDVNESVFKNHFSPSYLVYLFDLKHIWMSKWVGGYISK